MKIIEGKTNKLYDMYLEWLHCIEEGSKEVLFKISMSRYANFKKYNEFKEMIQNDSIEYGVDYSISETFN